MDSSSQFELFSTDDEPDAGENAPPNEPPAVTTPPATETIDNARALRLRELRELAKTHGHIPGVPIFSTWVTRHDCMDAAVHRSLIGGIYGNKVDGVSSIVVSGSYEDDEDGGDTIIYTGSGGRKNLSDDVPPKRLHFGPQIRDQSWGDTRNQAMITSHNIGNPIRVVRSWKCVSKYAPVTGYRYDGLYQIVAHWTGRGKSGFAICRCRLERLPDQPPIPIRPPTIPATNRRRKRGSNLTSSHHASNSSSSSGTGIPSSTSYDYITDSDDFDFDVESPRQRRRTDDAGHAVAHSVLDPTPEVGGTSGSAQQPMVPEPPAPLAVEDTDTKIPLQPLGDCQPVPPTDPNSLPNDRWDSNTKTLVEVPRPVPEEPVAPDGYQSEDEDEDVDMDAKDRMPTEYFSDIYEDTPDLEVELPYGSPGH